MNRLANETSPYLLQHAQNPVEWYPWGEEAFEKACREDKPIFLSVGYSACHWCHVMERESFENVTIAKVLNEHFVSIKVDREERPDVDGIYMAAVTALTGSGGWPMSVFLTPDLKPFYAGTYFPPDNRYGRPGFITILYGVLMAWQERRGEVLNTAEDLRRRLAMQNNGYPLPPGSLSPDLLAYAANQLSGEFDENFGGWSGAPKFPPCGAIMALLRHYGTTGDPEILHQVTFTLDAMARGGLYDHVGGGFHRYSVDEHWLVPHFEKMLYDNAQLAQAYVEAWQVTGNPFYRCIVEETLDYVLRDMRDPLGGFHSSEDADSEGQEGKFYLWTRRELEQALGAADAGLFCAQYSVREEGNFPSHEPYHAGQNILHRAQHPEKLAMETGLAQDALEEKLQGMQATLRERRLRRVRPGRDDKVLTAWNGLMISALAQAAQAFQEPRYLSAGMEAGQFILNHMRRGGMLLRTHRQGKSQLPGYLDDYAFVINAFVDLYEATLDPSWAREAEALTETMICQFWSQEKRVFFYTSDVHSHLIVRSRHSVDGAEPSGNSIAALGLLRLGLLLQNEGYTAKARHLLEAHAALLERAPAAFLRMICAAGFMLHPPVEIVVAGPLDHPLTQDFLRYIRTHFIPFKILAGIRHAAHDLLPITREKPPVNGKPAAYVCRAFTCQAPVSSVEELDALLNHLCWGQR